MVDTSTAVDPVEHPAAARFELAAWDGASVRGVKSGTLTEASASATFHRGCTGLTLELPRRSGPPLRGEAGAAVAVAGRAIRVGPARTRGGGRSGRTTRRRSGSWRAPGRWATAGPSTPAPAAAPELRPRRDGECRPARGQIPRGGDERRRRVFVDDRPLIQAWAPRPATTDEAVVELGPGRHEWRVEYFNAAGEFHLSLEPRRDAAAAEPVTRRRGPGEVAAAVVRHLRAGAGGTDADPVARHGGHAP